MPCNLNSNQENFSDHTNHLAIKNEELVENTKIEHGVNGISSVLLEKQLLAVQSLLKEEIADEKRKITQLLSRLRVVFFKT